MRPLDKLSVAVSIGDENIENEPDPAHESQAISSTDKAQHSVFSTWLASKSKQASIEDAALKVRAGDNNAGKILSDPRDYQVELFERAKTQNTIAVLETGKTLIAVMLLRHVIDKELEDRAAQKPPRISFFIVDSVSLVFQQYRVIESNIAQTCDKFCGEMGCDLWSEGVWKEHISKNMIIVCTAQILHNILDCGFLTIGQINLIVFDEAHKAKKGHVYASIMHLHYARTTGTKPKILGLTASPVDGKVDVEFAIKYVLHEKRANLSDLERVLDAQIATAGDSQELRNHVAKPTELFIQYPCLLPEVATPLRLEIEQLAPDLKVVQTEIKSAQAISSQLGSWAGDRVFSMLESDVERLGFEARLGQELNKAEPLKRGQMEKQRAALLACLERIKRERPRANNISAKVQTLAQFLTTSFSPQTGSRCIVFVRMRRTAILLAEIFEEIGNPTLSIGVLIGSNRHERMNMTFQQQNQILQDFRKGSLNLLFATSVAEEGIDISDCNMIIRLIQYIQSKGRARQHSSTYVHMVESGNVKEQSLISQVQGAEDLFRAFCQALPDDRKLQLDDWDKPDHSEEVFVDNESQATLSHSSSMVVLARYLALHPENTGEAVPQYVATNCPTGFVAEVILPSYSLVTRSTGKVFPRKSLAKRSAAFAACMQLYKRGLLDSRFLPALRRKQQNQRGHQAPMPELMASEYDMLIKPAFWSANAVPLTLYLLIISISGTDSTDQPLPEFAILTRHKLPDISVFPIYNENGSTSYVKCISPHQPLAVDASQLDFLTSFTLTVFKDVFSKEFERDQERTPYWFCPLVAEKIDEKMGASIDWDLLRTIASSQYMYWNMDSPQANFKNRFVVDYRVGSRRFFTSGVEQTKTPIDAQSDAVSDGSKSILGYSYAYREPPRTSGILEQPVFKARILTHRDDWLALPPQSDHNAAPDCWICLSAFAISMSLWKFPAIMYQLDCHLLAAELLLNLNIQANPKTARDAITLYDYNAPSDPHRLETYERLEFLGDCFLKCATAISLFVGHPEADEHELHMFRREMVCNNNLLKVAKSLEVHKYIRSLPFSRRTWYPQEIRLLKGKGMNAKPQKQTHNLGDKNVADVAEAIIGAAYLYTRANLDNAVGAVSTLVKNDNHTQHHWADYLRDYNIPEYQTAPLTASDLDLSSRISEKIIYSFKYPKLLRSAFNHPSWPTIYDNVPSYQRLEFLGDALLDMCAVEYLFHSSQGQDQHPQWLTEHKMAMVSNRFFAALAVKLELYRDLRHRTERLGKQIVDYVDELRVAEETVNGRLDYWNSLPTNPPKVLADLVESLIGAMFVDSNFDMAVITAFFEQHIRPFFTDLSFYDSYTGNNSVTSLKTALAELGCTSPHLPTAVIEDEHEDDSSKTSASPTDELQEGSFIAAVIIHLEVLGEGRGPSARVAKAKACEDALKRIQGVRTDRAAFKELVKCDCPSNTES